MTLNLAYDPLRSRPLVFGDSEQIASVNFIVAVQDAYDRYRHCSHKDEGICDTCDGEGTVECECDCGDWRYKTCDDCDGTGEQPICKLCIPSISSDVEIALRDVIKRGWPKIEPKAA